MGVRGFDLLKIATELGYPTVMLTAHAFTPEALKQSIELGASAYLPKEQLARPCSVPGRCPQAELWFNVEEGTGSDRSSV